MISAWILDTTSTLSVPEMGPLTDSFSLMGWRVRDMTFTGTATGPFSPLPQRDSRNAAAARTTTTVIILRFLLYPFHRSFKEGFSPERAFFLRFFFRLPLPSAESSSVMISSTCRSINSDSVRAFLPFTLSIQTSCSLNCTNLISTVIS